MTTNNNDQKTMTKKYQFVTIVATPEIREQFTQLRDKLNATDKSLMSAVWEIVNKNINTVEELVNSFKSEKASKKQELLAAKKSAKTPGKRGRKPKAEKEQKTESVKKVLKKVDKKLMNKGEEKTLDPVDLGEQDDDALAPLVVDGTK